MTTKGNLTEVGPNPLIENHLLGGNFYLVILEANLKNV
jgi:hypothetical protein